MRPRRASKGSVTSFYSDSLGYEYSKKLLASISGYTPQEVARSVTTLLKLESLGPISSERGFCYAQEIDLCSTFSDDAKWPPICPPSFIGRQSAQVSPDITARGYD